MPLHRRMPKRGFTNIFRKEWTTVSVEALERLFPAGDDRHRRALRKTAGGQADERGRQGARHGRAQEGARRLGPQIHGRREEEDRGRRRPLRGPGARDADPRVVPQHLRDPGPEEARPLHVRPARDLPDRFAHPDAGPRRRRRSRSSSRRAPGASSGSSTCSRAARSAGSPCSRSASRRTSRRRSSCSS